MKAPAVLRQSLAVRIALMLGLLSLVVVLALGLAIDGLTSRYLWDRADDDLAALVDFYAAYTTATAPDEARLAALAPQITGFFAPQAGYDVRLFRAPGGSLLASSRDIGALPSSAARADLSPRQPALFLPGSYDDPRRLYAARPILGAEGLPIAVVEVSTDVSAIRALLGTLRLVVLGASGLALALALAASALLARQIARPLRQMEKATQAVAAGDFQRRLAAAGEDEVGRLAASINRMAADLARLEAARREFLARVSHDLRTPLTAIKGLVINLQDTAPGEMQPALATMDEQTDRLIRLVNDLLALSRAQRGEMRLRLAPVDLAGLARSAVALVGERAGRMGVALHADLPAGLPTVPGDADRLQQVVLNLLDNALRVTPAGGQVWVRVLAGAGEVTLTVCDEGRGLTEAEAAHAFEPYVRGPAGEAGALGLGLTIAREIVAAHHGRIWLRPRAGCGAEAGLALPRERTP